MKPGQFLTKLSNHNITRYSRHDSHIEFMGPNEGDPVICLDTYWETVKAGNIGFR